MKTILEGWKNFDSLLNEDACIIKQDQREHCFYAGAFFVLKLILRMESENKEEGIESLKKEIDAYKARYFGNGEVKCIYS